jgi:hypothetical protein
VNSIPTGDFMTATTIRQRAKTKTDPVLPVSIA